MKRFATIITAAAIITAFFHSCSVDNSSSSTTVSAYTVYVQNGLTQGYFVTDDSLQIYPTNSISDLENGDRVTISWVYDASQAWTSPLYVEVTNHYEMMLEKAIKSEKPDTLGNLGADLVYLSDGTAGLWKSGGVYGADAMINIAFEYLCSETATDHKVALSYSSDPIDENDYFHFKFSHSSETDLNPYTSSSALFSFTLPVMAYTSDVKGVVITFDGLTSGSKHSYRYTYKTQKTEVL